MTISRRIYFSAPHDDNVADHHEPRFIGRWPSGSFHAGTSSSSSLDRRAPLASRHISPWTR